MLVPCRASTGTPKLSNSFSIQPQTSLITEYQNGSLAGWVQFFFWLQTKLCLVCRWSVRLWATLAVSLEWRQKSSKLPWCYRFPWNWKEEITEWRVIMLPQRPFWEAAFSQPTNSRCLIKSSRWETLVKRTRKGHNNPICIWTFKAPVHGFSQQVDGLGWGCLSKAAGKQAGGQSLTHDSLFLWLPRSRAML